VSNNLKDAKIWRSEPGKWGCETRGPSMHKDPGWWTDWQYWGTRREISWLAQIVPGARLWTKFK
jgi:hypothetical protein